MDVRFDATACAHTGYNAKYTLHLVHSLRTMRIPRNLVPLRQSDLLPVRNAG
ncbi:MAG: hypothetical protein GY944_29545 [bacterium]|nr:hypothetical protein [bacterium]